MKSLTLHDLVRLSFGLDDYIFANHAIECRHAAYVKKRITSGHIAALDAIQLAYDHMRRRGCNIEHIEREMCKVHRLWGRSAGRRR